jgi:hypothetical protein
VKHVINGPIVINQDHEIDYDGEVGSAVPVFWAKGHGYDEGEFVRAVIDYCLGNDVTIPRFDPYDDKPVETWQQNVSVHDGIEYRRDSTPPNSLRSSRFPITILDLERPRRRGATKCGVNGCDEPWGLGVPIKVAIEPDDSGMAYTAVTIWLCREHAARFPEPSYRVCMVPVGATIMLPAEAAS